MVLRNRDCKMASEQPVKKKLRITEEDDGSRDEIDFIHSSNSPPENGGGGMRTDLTALQLTLPSTVNEADIGAPNNMLLMNNCENANNRTYCNNRTNNENDRIPQLQDVAPAAPSGPAAAPPALTATMLNGLQIPIIPFVQNASLNPAPDILLQHFAGTVSPSSCIASSVVVHSFCSSSSSSSSFSSNHHHHQQQHHLSITAPSSAHLQAQAESDEQQSQDNGLDVDMLEFQNHLVRQCLCGVSETALRKPFVGQRINDATGSRTATLSEWPMMKILQFLSNLQLLFDVYLKQNNKGHICSRISYICDVIVRNEHNLIEQIMSLIDVRNRYVNYLSARVLASFLIIAKTNINNEWLETIVSYLTADSLDYERMNFSLEIIKRVVEWKDVEIHVLEESQVAHDGAGPSNPQAVDISLLDDNLNCTTVAFTDPESFDTSSIKGLLIKSLESRWPELISKIQQLISHNTSVQSQTCILTFLALWESIISVRANLSVVDTKPFYAHLEIFVRMLHNSLPPLIWKQLLSLFNEVLCYGSTLALQDTLPDETCQLAHFIVRYVKDYRLLDNLPYRRGEGQTVNSFVGTIANNNVNASPQSSIDKTLLQKMVLLVLKSVAITIKETRSDSSDSSVGSDDFEFYQDMLLIERSIRDVLRKVDVFIKNSLDFHPETTFSKILIHLFSDQDDYMIESMVCTLDITVGISYRNAVFPDLISMLNPTFTFVEFLKIVSHDSDVLLDYLVSNETCFLLYLLRFLKYTRRNWSKFTASCETCTGGSGISRNSNELDNTMTVLIRLKMQISRLVDKQLFPYPISPVLKLLDACESLYEGNEYS